jgi:hypothetical protein
MDLACWQWNPIATFDGDLAASFSPKLIDWKTPPITVQVSDLGLFVLVQVCLAVSLESLYRGLFPVTFSTRLASSDSESRTLLISNQAPNVLVWARNILFRPRPVPGASGTSRVFSQPCWFFEGASSVPQPRC